MQTPTKDTSVKCLVHGLLETATTFISQIVNINNKESQSQNKKKEKRIIHFKYCFLGEK